MKSTALGAENIIFISDAHEKFYYEKLQEVRYQDVYHKALCYCLGINGDTRKNADRIYNFKTGSVKTKCLHEGWQTSGSLKVVRMAFNLYCNSTPRVTLKTMMENIIMGLEFDPREAILHHEEGIDVIPSNKLLSGMDMSLFTVEDREKVLKEYLELLENDYDYILIDCMPSLGMMTINALSAADSVLIPVQPQYYAADGLMELLKVVKGIHQRFNPDLQIEGILFTMDSSHYNNSKRNKQAVRDAYGAEIIIFDQTIPRTEALAETASEGVSIFSYDAKGKGAYSYQALVQEVLNHA